jgi:hypothetical protein
MLIKKIILIGIALFTLLTTAAWGYLDASPPDRNRIILSQYIKNGLSRIISLSGNQFTVESRNGEQFTFLVDEDTVFRNRDLENLEMTDLRVNQWVIVRGKENGDLDQIARLVVILPDDFNPDDWSIINGVISGLDQEDSVISVLNRKGESIELIVSEKTKFKGEVDSFNDLESGMRVWIMAWEQDDGKINAQIIRAAYRVKRSLGEVIDINPAENEFTVRTRRGDQELVFEVNDKTRWLGQDVLVENIENLAPGMRVFTISIERDDGELFARVVIVLQQKEENPI